MKKRGITVRILAVTMASLLLGGALVPSARSWAEDTTQTEDASSTENESSGRFVGGGYAVTGQIKGVGYTEELYDATNGLPTSDANCVFSSSDGYIWVGGYGGILRYDGNTFERLDSRGGLTSGRCIFEDADKRMWFGTNDNGVVVMDGTQTIRITDKDGLPSLSIRGISQCGDGTVIVGTANGLVAVDQTMKAHPLSGDSVGNQYILQLANDAKGRVCGAARSGEIFLIEGKTMTECYSSSKIGIGEITYVFPDPESDEEAYFGTLDGEIFHGIPGKKKEELKPCGKLGEEILGITSACNRIWVNTSSASAYLDKTGSLVVLRNLPMQYAIEMMTADYQGNLWYASSRQGVMKVVSSNFRDVMEIAGFEPTVVNTTCMRDGLLYIGTDDGLKILTSGERPFRNELAVFMDETRIRCIAKDKEDNLWFCCYTGDKGVVCYTRDNKMIHYTTANGLIQNEARCVTFGSDGSVYVGTNGGLSVIKDGKVAYNIGEEQGMVNTSLLTVCESGDGRIYAGSDGNGIHVIEDGKIVDEITRDDGLTSEVILRIKYDETRNVDWLVTSNSIQYIRDGKVHNVSTFPYNNNFDVYYGNDDNIWILSSYGIYCVKSQALLEDNVNDYKLYTIANGLPGVPTANAYSDQEEDGTLYVAERTGVCKMNIKRFFESRSSVILGVSSVVCDGTPLSPDEDGNYDIPKDAGRLQIAVAALDYTMANPTVRVYLEGSEDEGITVTQDKLSSLEYTSLHYGDYTLYMQIIDPSTGAVYQEETVNIIKKPGFFEMPVVQILGMAFLLVLAAFLVWRIMSSTVVRRQYREIRAARIEIAKANAEKTGFLANMSHEIRTPINTILGVDELMLREDATDVPEHYTAAVTKYVKDIHTASRELLGYINEIFVMEEKWKNKEKDASDESGEEIRLGSYVPMFIAPEAEVLVVDENAMNLAVIRELLRATRVFVITSDSREDCLEKVKYGSFDLVILDDMMATDVLTRFHEMQPELPVYALSADLNKSEEDFRSEGFAGVLSMPVEPRDLEKIIMTQLPEKIMMKPGEDSDV
ncbi:MAG: response regulator [Eubacterium sp.]|nr:response regulator [Eubacterium sp.]